MIKQQHDNIKILSWDTDGRLNPIYDNHEIIMSNIYQHNNKTVIIIQKAAGLKGGYRNRKNNILTEIPNMNLVTTDA